MINFAFFFSFVDNDFLLACHLVDQIKEYYPEVMTLAIGDGASKENRLDCVCWHEDQLKKPETIGHFTQRNFQFMLDVIAADSSINYIIKLDPDSFLRKKAFNLPESDWVGQVKFGNFSWGSSTWAKGGAYCISKTAIEKIVESRLLLEPRLQKPEEFEVRQQRIYEDCRLGFVANQLDIFPVPWPDVSVDSIHYKSKLARRFSILHPAKDKI